MQRVMGICWHIMALCGSADICLKATYARTETNAVDGEYKEFYVFFFFQAEDGIRDYKVTGVQTCALPILRVGNVFHAGDGNLHPNILYDPRKPGEEARVVEAGAEIMRLCAEVGGSISRSEERRVGEEGRSRWAPDHLKKKKKNT